MLIPNNGLDTLYSESTANTASTLLAFSWIAPFVAFSSLQLPTAQASKRNQTQCCSSIPSAWIINIRTDFQVSCPSMTMVWTSRAKRARNDQEKSTSKKNGSKQNKYEQIISPAEVLDYTRYFSNERQMKPYLADFARRTLVEPKIMDCLFFESSGFEFVNLLKYQGLDKFLSLDGTYFPDIVKVFYGNYQRVCSEVKNIKMRVKPRDWLTISHLKYQGHKLDFSNLGVWENYDCDIALATMVRPGQEVVQCRRHFCDVGYQTITSNQLAKLHMPAHDEVQGQTQDALPYGILITKIMEHHSINLVTEVKVSPGWASNFKKRSLKKLTIKIVNGMWQIGDGGVNKQEEHGKEEAGSKGEEPDAPQVTPDHDILNRIFNGIQGILHSLDGLTITMHDLEQKVDNKFDAFGKRLGDLEHLYHRRQSE
ncbi:hypothetical protein VNO78_23460 [Psophocarpus tetragonolobus]|uniref:Uncharacterized protein n=1 Tax=Psophocarpus tetragonolobus TaxID=3891 RepID=A0AAN9S6R4_PSOTE